MDAHDEQDLGRRRRPAGWMSAEQLHRTLTAFNRERLSPCLPAEDAADALAREGTLRRMELAFLAAERTRAAEQLREVPTRPGPFLEWFLSLREGGPGQGDPLFPYLAERASLQEMRWFLLQEVAGESCWRELVTLVPLRLAARPRPEPVHGCPSPGEAGWPGPCARLTQVAAALELRPTSQNTVWEAAALSNLEAGLAWNRHYAFHAVGALAAAELTAPGRLARVEAGLQRLGVPVSLREERAVSAGGQRQVEAWCRSVLHPLLRERAEVAAPLAEGALMRMGAAARCLERYRRELGISGGPPITLH